MSPTTFCLTLATTASERGNFRKTTCTGIVTVSILKAFLCKIWAKAGLGPNPAIFIFAMAQVLIEAGRPGFPKLPGFLETPRDTIGIVIFAHGSGSSRLSPRNRRVAETLNRSKIGTLLFDLLTQEESEDRSKVFDIPLLAERLAMATRWLLGGVPKYPLGYFGASTGAAAALWAASDLGKQISAIVSRGGRPDLAIPRLSQVSTPTLLLVGSEDTPVIELNQEALKYLSSGELRLIPGATHLFEEPGRLDLVAHHALEWFSRHFFRREPGRSGQEAA